MDRQRDRGFTLVEVAVVVMIIAIILVIAVPAYQGFRERAADTKIKSNITLGAKVQAARAADGQGFTTDVAVLALVEPSLDFSGATDSSLHLEVQDAAVVGDKGDVLIYARSDGGTWFGLRLVQSGADAGRYTCSGAAEGDVDDFADCTGQAW